eukprot:CAMPEP_0116896560 /NCGR_PEP_ID=MMETSP0467-20121206/5770_1 /TAXON_ID=283647 /ORGANISM="Mesodinium pulex, Strain SPMC105" /LENGTH=223 /DNA_ID=CAMNT_0004567785 /DNA_START=123 /DNA_END=794 /DNA_ORIENTATION=-
MCDSDCDPNDDKYCYNDCGQKHQLFAFVLLHFNVPLFGPADVVEIQVTVGDDGSVLREAVALRLDCLRCDKVEDEPLGLVEPHQTVGSAKTVVEVAVGADGVQTLCEVVHVLKVGAVAVLDVAAQGGHETHLVVGIHQPVAEIHLQKEAVVRQAVYLGLHSGTLLAAFQQKVHKAVCIQVDELRTRLPLQLLRLNLFRQIGFLECAHCIIAFHKGIQLNCWCA